MKHAAYVMVPIDEPPAVLPGGKPTSRADGMRTLSVNIPAQQHKTLRRLAAETDRTMQDLVSEALEDLFNKLDSN
ncbi:ribbon-helix-helix domain-containing protein [Methylobacterium nodulans]|uniref:Antitoxin-like ribbon-helix-helix domain-containing protein n=1 Tax=Methylobacterium nodulans (strain LMG 21967 / CNCM I-2342 / ORS 2060) TaxID=460265 RepID=B8IY18_METNO|nr:ribbon-helix-helix domain-containing protein [Methylobacterium nodulans]ACL63308.1 hypothetical protein Mnod_7715 [Methylobacterium nodulans ORS 2060]